MLSTVKTKKRSRLALPRQKGARIPSTVPTPQGSHDPAQASSETVTASDSRAGAEKASGASVDYLRLPAASTASSEEVSSGSTKLQARAAENSAPKITPAAVHAGGNGDCLRVGAASTPIAQKRVIVSEEVSQKGGEGGKRTRDPLQVVQLNFVERKEETTAAAARRNGKQATAAATSAAAAAAAVVTAAAAAAEAWPPFDSLDHIAGKSSSASNVPPPRTTTTKPPQSPLSQRNAKRRTSRVLTDPQRPRHQHRHQPQPQPQPQPEEQRLAACCKRPRSSTTTTSSDANRLVSSRAPAPPSPKWNGIPTAERGSDGNHSLAIVAAPASTAAGAAEAAGTVVLRGGDGRTGDESPPVLFKSPGSGGRGSGRGSGAGIGADRASPNFTSAKQENGTSSSFEQRERCPVCGCAVWGLGIRARQVHINSCLDGTSAAGASGASAGAGAVGGVPAGQAEDRTKGAGAAPPGWRSAAAGPAVATEPKTEYQERIQMAKALSRSLVAPTPTPAATAAAAEKQDQETEEELMRNPAAFRAKEKRLVQVLTDLDSKLERLNKDRDAALRKLAAHRALGARASASASAGFRVSGEEDCRGGDGGGGGVLKTVEEVVDIIFPGERSVAATGRSSTRSEGQRQRRQAEADAAAAAAVTSFGEGATGAYAREVSPSTASYQGRGYEITPAAAAADGESGDLYRAAAPRRPAGVVAGGLLADAAARGADPPALAPSSGGYCCNSDDVGCRDCGGGARLTRRRSSGGDGGYFGCGNRHSLSSSSARGSERGKGRKTLWGIAQDAGKLSQSNFVTGVFADIRGAAAKGGAGRDKKPQTYESASLCNCRARSSRPAIATATASAAGGGTSLASTSRAKLDPRVQGVGASDAAAATADGGENSDVDGESGGEENANETEIPDGNVRSLCDGSGAPESTDTMDRAIVLLSQSQRLSAGPPSPKFPVQKPDCQQRGNSQASGVKEDSNISAASAPAGVKEDSNISAASAPPDEGGEGDYHGATIAAAQHIARAPVAALAGLFPSWEENVRFVFQQGAAELREALESIAAALAEGEATVTAMAAAAAVAAETDGRSVFEPDGGRKDARSVARVSDGRPGRGAGGGGGGSCGGSGCRGNGGGKAEALLFFKGVILEALMLTGSGVPPSSSSPPPPSKELERADGTRDNRSRSSSVCGRGFDDDGRGRQSSRGDGSGGEQSDGDVPARTSSLRSAERARWGKDETEGKEQGLKREKEEEGQTNEAERHRMRRREARCRVDSCEVGGAGEDRLSFAVAEGAAGQALGVIVVEVLRGVDDENGDNGEDEPNDVAAVNTGSNVEMVEAADGPQGENSVEPIVLSGDDCCDAAAVTFNLPRSDSLKVWPATALPAAGADADALADAPVTAEGAPQDGAVGESGRRRCLPRDAVPGVSNDEGEDDEDDDFPIVGNGGGGGGGGGASESLSRTGGMGAAYNVQVAGSGNDGVDGHVAEDDGGYFDDYCPWDDNHDYSMLPSPDVGDAAGEECDLPSPTQLLPPLPSPEDHIGGGRVSGSEACFDDSRASAELLDLTQMAPSPPPPPPSNAWREGDIELAAATEPNRGRSPPRCRDTLTPQLRDHHSAASPPRDEKEQGARVAAAAAAMAPSPEDCRNGARDKDGMREVMPSFDQMTLQELAGMMASYGLKKKSKREMTQRLEHIWKTLHPTAAAAAAGEGDISTTGDTGNRSTNASSSLSGSRRRDAPFRDRGTVTGAGGTLSAPQARHGATAAATAGAAASTRLLGRLPISRPPLPPPPVDTRGETWGRAEGGGFSQKSARAFDRQREEDGEEEVIPPLPALSWQPQRPRVGENGCEEGASAALGKQIRAVIRGFAPLHEDILLLRTIELSATQRLLKESGVKCSKKDLASYLDAWGVTFVDRGNKRGGGGDDAGRQPRKKKKRGPAVGTS